MTDASIAYNLMKQTNYDLGLAYSQTNYINFINDFAKRGTAGFNVGGIPWVVSAEKGIPQFYQYAYNNRILFTRKVLFSRYANAEGQPDTNRPPQFTNQFYVFAVSNSFGTGAWNPYTNAYTGSLGTTYFLSNYVTIELTNNQSIRPFGFVTNFSVEHDPVDPRFPKLIWPAWSGAPNATSTAGFVTLEMTTSRRDSTVLFLRIAKPIDLFHKQSHLEQFVSAAGHQPNELACA